MIPDQLQKWQVRGLAAAAPITGAAPQTVNGNPVDIRNVETGTLSARVNSGVTANGLTLAGKWQVKNKAGTWVDVAHDANNPAAVVFHTGTGSLTTLERVFPAPAAVYGFREARFVVTSGAAAGSGGAADVINALDYSYREAWISY